MLHALFSCILLDVGRRDCAQKQGEVENSVTKGFGLIQVSEISFFG
jgi:hypothetical protein